MNKFLFASVVTFLVTFLFTVNVFAHEKQHNDSKQTKPATEVKPTSSVIQLEGDDQPLFKPPFTKGMRSGHVQLKKGKEIGWHSTENYEEVLVVLKGSGERSLKSPDGTITKSSFKSPCSIYVPTATEHNVQNVSEEVLEYVYIVAPVSQK